MRPVQTSAWIRAAALLGILSATAVCTTRSGPRPLPPTPGTTAEPDEMSLAIAHYRETGDATRVEAWIAAHPGEDRAAVWHEMLALHAYDAAFVLGEDEGEGFDPPPVVSSTQLRRVASEYEGTFAASMATSGLDTETHVLEEVALSALSHPAVNPRVVQFFDGHSDWVADVNADQDGLQMDLRRFRQRHEPTLRAGFLRQLLTDGCRTTMGYCNWYVDRYPNGEGIAELQDAIKQVWWDRGHPPWQGKAYLQCAYDCSSSCRNDAEPLDDSCYDSCFSRC